MSQLPYTSPHQHHNLRHTIPDSSRISTLAQIPKIGLSFPLILLFSPDILKLQIKIPDLGSKLRYVSAVMLKVGLSGAYYDVEVETDVGVGKPGGVIRGEADGVIACFVRGECEAAFGGAFGFYYGV
jgi:hypothetical protein